jgi:hypothetical protein
LEARQVTKLGTCKLCTLKKELQDSHFIGKAVYKKLMEPSIKNPQPIVITSKNFKQSPVQLRDDVFCFDCEQIFNSGGESWMHRHIATTAGFKLLGLFNGQKPIAKEPDFALYDAATIPAVDCAAMLEYGTGVFFKSAVHTWNFDDGTSSHIDISQQQIEALRKFVHRETTFPQDMVLTVCLSSKAKQFLGFIPPIEMEDKKYYFYVSGVYYCLTTGAGIDSNLKAIAFNQSVAKPIFVGEEWGFQALGIIKNLANGVVPSPKLKDGLKPKSGTPESKTS